MKPIPILFVFLSIFLSAISANAQTSYFEYKYDDSGNRIQRKVVVVASPPSQPPPAMRAYTTEEVQDSSMVQDSVATLKTDSAIAAQNNNTASFSTPADVFPTPTYGLVNIIIQGEGVFTGVLFNSESKMVLETQFYSGQNTMDVSNYGDGMFVLKITSPEGKTQEFKIIKKS